MDIGVRNKQFRPHQVIPIMAINPAQEHFMSNLIRQKLIVAIDQFVYHGGGKKFMLFLPEGELHEISLLIVNIEIYSFGFLNFLYKKYEQTCLNKNEF